MFTDLLGKEINIGDNVVVCPANTMYYGTISKLCPKRAAVEVSNDLFGAYKYYVPYDKLAKVS